MRHTLLISLISATALGLTACSTPAAPTSTPSSASQSATLKTGSVSPLTQPDLERAKQIAAGSIPAVTGSQGYTFKLDFTMSPGNGSQSVTNSAPGKAAVTWNFPITIIATNTAEGRASDIGNIQDISVDAIWSEGSPLCSTHNTNTTAGSGTYPWHVVHGQDGHALCVGTLRNLGGITGSIPVGGSYSVKADRPVDITVPESSSQAVLDALVAGPVAWSVNKPGAKGTCGPDDSLWMSASALGCPLAGSPGLTVEAASQLSIKALDKLHLLLSGPQGGSPTCPFGSGPNSWAAGMMPESLQATQWKAEPYESSEFPAINGVECRGGGMAVAVLSLAGTETTSFLANDKYAEWDEIQGPADLAGGKAYFSSDSIRPESGDAYGITRFAWRSGTGDLLFMGKLVGSNPAQTYAWLKQNLGPMLGTLTD